MTKTYKKLISRKVSSSDYQLCLEVTKTAASEVSCDIFNKDAGKVLWLKERYSLYK